MFIQAQLEPRHRANARHAARRRLQLEFCGATSDKRLTGAVIQNLSQTGLLMQTTARLDVGEMLDVDIPEVGLVSAAVIWMSGDLFGCQFREPITRSALSAAVLRSDPFFAVAEPASIPDIANREDAEWAEPSDTSKLPFGTRLRIIFGLSVGLWSLILFAVSRVI